MSHTSTVNSEIIQIIESVAKDKDINRESLMEAMEQAIQIAGRRKYGHKQNIRAEIDRKTGEIRMFREFYIVENDKMIENPTTEISLKDAKLKDPNCELGGVVTEALPPIDLGRVAAQAAKQVIVQKVRDAERERQYDNFKNRVGEIMNGIVKRIEFGNLIIDIGRDEAILKRNQLIPNEIFKINDRIKVYVEDVKRVTKGPQIFLSRNSEKFLAKLFEQEIPEIYDGLIEIKAVARDPGSRAKMAVYSQDSSIDPVGSCVGIRGARVKAVTEELHGEKIDIINWSADPATFVINSLAPAEVSKVIIDEDRRKIEVVVPAEQQSLAIGRKGQNVGLAIKLTGWGIDLLTEDEESKRRVEEFRSITALFIQTLNVEEIVAERLASEGFSTVEDVLQVRPSDLMPSTEGFNQEDTKELEDLVAELRKRAGAHIEEKNKEINIKIANLGVDSKLQSFFKSLSRAQILKLAENGIKELEDLGELTKEKFMEIIPDSGFPELEIEKIITLAKNVDMK